jgi:hypothetical protein
VLQAVLSSGARGCDFFDCRQLRSYSTAPTPGWHGGGCCARCECADCPRMRQPGRLVSGFLVDVKNLVLFGKSAKLRGYEQSCLDAWKSTLPAIRPSACD